MLGEQKRGEEMEDFTSLHGAGQGGGSGSGSDRMVDKSWERLDMLGERARRYARCRVLV
jgi:hypothetical protein